MVSTEISLNFANDNNSLQTRLEEVNPSYKRARELYNTLIKRTINPLENNGLSGDRNSFVIILLEKILRNTELILEQNTLVRNKINTVDQNICQLKQEGLDPIINAGNIITTELKLFEIGFQAWNTKFDTFQEVFETWNTGFNKFDENFSKLDKFLTDFSAYWSEKTNIIQRNLTNLEKHITQWNDEIIRVNNCIESLEKRFINFEQRQSFLARPRPLVQTAITTPTTDKQLYQVLPSNNHKWKL